MFFSFLLVNFLTNLEALNKAIKKNVVWYGRQKTETPVGGIFQEKTDFPKGGFSS